MTRPLPWLLGVVAAMLFTVFLWQRDESGPRVGPRLVVLYATCTLNVNELSPYAPEVEFTPHLGDFAHSSVVFTRHQTESGQSGVAFASIFSGDQAVGHGVFTHPTRLADSVDLITETFRDAGYETFFWADQVMASPDLNYAQGVDPANVYGVASKARPASAAESFLTAEDPRFAHILQRLGADPEYRALVVTNFSVTHALYDNKHVGRFCERFPLRCGGLSQAEIGEQWALFAKHIFSWIFSFEATREQLRLSEEEVARLVQVARLVYQSNVFHLDELFGAVVERIRMAGLEDESLIAFTADHGEVLHRDNALEHWTHGFQLAPEVLRVPWIVRAPGLGPARYDEVTRSVDVFPTLAGLSHVELPTRERMGVDLAPALLGRSGAPHLLAYSHTALPPESLYQKNPPSPTDDLRRRFPGRSPGESWVAVRDGDLVFKLTSEDGAVFHPFAYDWGIDPEERTDLYDPDSRGHRDMIQRLEAYKANLVAAHRRWLRDAPEQLPEAEREGLLRSLGYIE